VYIRVYFSVEFGESVTKDVSRKDKTLTGHVSVHGKRQGDFF